MISDLSWDHYDRRLNEEKAVVFIPVGAVEQHGFHLPLGTDWMMATYLARKSAEIVGGIVAPPLMFGARSQVRSGGGPCRCGTTSLSCETLIGMLGDVISEIVRHGARKIAIIDGHFENKSFLDEACFRTQRDLAARGASDLKIMKLLYGERMKASTLEAVYKDVPNPGLELEHAGMLETSAMLHCYPEHVQMEKIPDEAPPKFPPYDVYPPRQDWVPRSGSLSSGKAATAAIGKLLVDEFIEGIVDATSDEFLSK